MSSESLVKSVDCFLKHNYIYTDTDWLTECVEYLSQDTTTKYTEEDIKRLAKEQWLLNDLRDICPGSLPPNMARTKKTTLEGNYVLQIDSVLDICKPVYQQYLNIRKVNMENIEATANHEEKIINRRMLKLHMTDGNQEVSGIERKPMRNLHCNITPGSKILIKGPVECREGVMFLYEHSIELMGGEVTEIASTNSYVAMLAKKLNITHIEDPGGSVLNTGPSNLLSNIASHTSTITTTDRESEHNALPDRSHSPLDMDFLQTTSHPILPDRTSSHNTLNRDPSHVVLADRIPDRLSFEASHASISDGAFTYTIPALPMDQTANGQQSRPVARVKSLQVANDFPDDDIDMNQIAAIEAKIFSNQRPSKDDSPRPLKKAKLDSPKNKSVGKSDNSDVILINEDSLSECELRDDSIENIFKEQVYDIFGPSDPYISIKRMNEMKNKQTGQVFRIKARILRLLSKLSPKQGKWCLNCTLTDETGTLDVNFDSDVLSKLLGYTPQEMAVMKKRIAAKPELKEQMYHEVVTALDNARETLKNLNCIMEVTMSETPQITRLVGI